MLGVLILLALAPTNLSTPLLEARSARPVTEFGSCFARIEERGGRAWAYLPSERGGTFTDSGVREGAASYWLQIREAGTVTRLRLFAAAAAPRAIQTVEQCR